MTPEDTAAKFAALEQTLNDLQARVDALSKDVESQQAQIIHNLRRLEALGDYAGSTEYRVKQLKISTDARLSKLEDDNDAQK